MSALSCLLNSAWPWDTINRGRGRDLECVVLELKRVLRCVLGEVRRRDCGNGGGCGCYAVRRGLRKRRRREETMMLVLGPLLLLLLRLWWLRLPSTIFVSQLRVSEPVMRWQRGVLSSYVVVVTVPLRLRVAVIAVRVAVARSRGRLRADDEDERRELQNDDDVAPHREVTGVFEIFHSKSSSANDEISHG